MVTYLVPLSLAQRIEISKSHKSCPPLLSIRRFMIDGHRKVSDQALVDQTYSIRNDNIQAAQCIYGPLHRFRSQLVLSCVFFTSYDMFKEPPRSTCSCNVSYNSNGNTEQGKISPRYTNLDYLLTVCHHPNILDELSDQSFNSKSITHTPGITTVLAAQILELARPFLVFS